MSESTCFLSLIEPWPKGQGANPSRSNKMVLFLGLRGAFRVRVVMKNHSQDPAEAIALFRHGLIVKVQELLEKPAPLKTALATVASTPHLWPDGRQGPLSVRTLEDWWYAFGKGGFAALRPKGRSDRGQSRKLNPEQERRILAAVRAQPGIDLRVLYDQWKSQDPKLPSLSTVYRLLRANELDQRGRRYLLRQSITAPTKAFETPLVNDLWMVDFSPGPFLKDPAGGKARPTHLCALLDDHSRLAVHAQYYQRPDTQAFHHAFRQAILARGLPRKLYTDRGGPFVNDHTRVICANLQVRLLHAKPYHAWSKGKIERFIQTLQRGFEAGLRAAPPPPASLEELNHRLADWLATHYHRRVHQGIGMTPAERFAKGAHQIRPLDPHQDLERLFFHTVVRTVRKDGTVRLENRLYEVDLALRGLKVQLRYNPWKLDPIEVDYRGQSFGEARRVDLHHNSQINGSQHYER